ncbi:MAG: acylneuraminate cytidylyltransferase family protein [SAR202 cluster bacterium]|jgi:CMP-N-acetylneuraminic acid synthetase|nr:acylneuraminate cytidylyltransferase family protein [SAR202 cluster bacterium]
MGTDIKIIGLITARGGSKSVPRKNLAELGGKPVIAWTIETALQSSSVDSVIVSTDDDEIAEVSREWGAEVPFMRPAELSLDDTPHMAVMLHAIHWLERHRDLRPDYIMLLQPTSPLRTSADIDAAVRVARENSAVSVVSVCETHHHPYLIKRLAEDGTLFDFIEGAPQPGSMSIRRQAMEPAYVVNGSIYLNARTMLLEERTFLSQATLPYFMPNERSLQIDEPWDLHLAELILRDRS